MEGAKDQRSKYLFSPSTLIGVISSLRWQRRILSETKMIFDLSFSFLSLGLIPFDKLYEQLTRQTNSTKPDISIVGFLYNLRRQYYEASNEHKVINWIRTVEKRASCRKKNRERGSRETRVRSEETLNLRPQLLLR